ncbi:ferredoxin [Paenibacillus sp. NEAU-GSW1]|uniref:ferredoxin n=1 Tax=Paenibacillus sp. NEAU-GSW1 TaxID=2682486 RepID=UPI0012E2D0C5|nr:ferredoxin [Paenibacillus sp. NEAU-GSW1]MUT67983.1 hypothetical protein [Paenibacillus sp. NEAU-GSW1]
MRRIIVSDNCVACGSCTLESDLLIELDNGKAAPKGTGLITDDQYHSLLSTLENCPVHAISVVDDEITKSGGTASILELKKLIDDKLKAFKPEFPSTGQFAFNANEYIAPLLVNRYSSGYEYSTYDRAHDEGFSEFERTMYAQHQTLVQAVLIHYKVKQLSKFAYYKSEPGNYFFEICREVSKILAEIEEMAKQITYGQIALPEDFVLFEAGPDLGYEGDIYCYSLRNMERMEHFEKDYKPASYYDSYIDCNVFGDKYSYDLNKVAKRFREYVSFEVSHKVSSQIFEWLKLSLKPFEELVAKKINEKVVTIKAAIQACSQLDGADELIGVQSNKHDALRSELLELLENMKKTSLAQEYIFKSIDTDYNSDYRFTSASECREAAGNRLWRFYDSCQDYLSTGHYPRISEDLSKQYQAQIEAVFNRFKTNVQAVYDKFEIAYPQTEIKICADDETISVDFASFEDCNSNINYDIRDYMDERIIGSGGKVKHYDYFKYSTDEISIWDRSEWKKGFFGGETEYKMYGYLLSFNAMSGFTKACEACCDAAFSDGFLQNYLNKLINNMVSAFHKDVIAKISPPNK